MLMMNKSKQKMTLLYYRRGPGRGVAQEQAAAAAASIDNGLLVSRL